MSYFDDRIFKIVLTYGTTELTLDEGLYITAQGMKFADATQNECTIRIANLKKETREQLATQLTPWNYNQARKTVKLYSGRVSTGFFLLYEGDIIDCVASQPPNIILTIKSKAMQWYKYNILAQAHNVSAPLSEIGSGIARTLGIPMRFEATNKNIANYSYSGSAAKQIDKLNEIGGIDAYEDNGTLVIKDAGKALVNNVHELSMETGMIGTPESTEYGVRVRMLLAPGITLGGQISLKSYLNPLIFNGDYYIYKLGFDIASRDTPFYGIAECARFNILLGAANGLYNIP